MSDIVDRLDGISQGLPHDDLLGTEIWVAARELERMRVMLEFMKDRSKTLEQMNRRLGEALSETVTNSIASGVRVSSRNFGVLNDYRLRHKGL